MAKTPKRPRDSNQLAKFIMDLATGDATEPDPLAGKNPHAVALGKLGGAKGGAQRAKNMTAEQRKEAAKKAIQARWYKK